MFRITHIMYSERFVRVFRYSREPVCINRFYRLSPFNISNRLRPDCNIPNDPTLKKLIIVTEEESKSLEEAKAIEMHEPALFSFAIR